MLKHPDNEIEPGDNPPAKTSSSPTWLVCAVILVILVYLCMSSVEVYVLYEWLTWRFGLHGLLAAPAALLLGAVPVLGSLMCYWTATDIWHWESWQAIVAFFWIYLPIVLAVISVLPTLVRVCGLMAWHKIRKITGW